MKEELQQALVEVINSAVQVKDFIIQETPEVVQQLTEKLDRWKTTLPPKPTGNVFSAERSQSEADN